VRAGLIVLLLSAGLCVRWLLPVLGPPGVFLTVYPAVLLAAVLWGKVPGMVAAVVGQLAADFLFVEPPHHLHFTPLSLISLVALVGSALFIGHVSDRLRASRSTLNASLDVLLTGKHADLITPESADLITPDPVWQRDLVAGRLYWNKGVESTFGYPLSEVPTEPWWWYEHIHPEDRARVANSIDDLTKRSGQRFWKAEYRFLHRRGHWMSLQDHGYVFHNKQGRSVRMVGSILDITERKRAEKELQRSRDTLQAVLDASPAAVVVGDADGRILIANRATEGILGSPITGDAYHPQGNFQFCQPDGSPLPSELLPTSLVLKGKPFSEAEILVVRADEKRVTILASATTLRTAEGEVRRAVAVFQDVTERTGAAAQLQGSEERFRQLFENSPIGLLIMSPEGIVIAVNKAWREIWGLSEKIVVSQTLGQRLFDEAHIHPRGIIADLPKALRGEASTSPPELFDPAEMGKPGPARWVKAFTYPLKHLDGGVKEIVVMFDDVTEQHEAEITLQLLAETSELLATSLQVPATLERISMLAFKYFGGCCAIHRVSSDGGLVEAAVTPGCDAELVFGLRAIFRASAAGTFGPAHVLQTRRSEFIHRTNDSGNANLGLLERLQAQGVTSYMCVPMLVRGHTWGTMTFVANERSYTDEALGLAEQLARRAGLALENASLFDTAQKAIRLRDDFLSIASHELRTPLSSLRLQIEMMLRMAQRKGVQSPPPTMVMKNLEMQVRQVDRLSKFISELMDVSRISAGKLHLEIEEVDLAALVGDVAGRFDEEAAKAGCELVLVANEPVSGRWDRFRIEQVVTNLLTNALKYGAGKPVEVTVTKEGQFARLAVRDYGIGITPEDAKRLFERFAKATTARTYGGLGLGLYIAREIVEAHGGTIRVESHPGAGSTFTVELPSEPSPPKKEKERPAKPFLLPSEEPPQRLQSPAGWQGGQHPASAGQPREVPRASRETLRTRDARRQRETAGAQEVWGT
jgi:PAS domain S-box-containing protein